MLYPELAPYRTHSLPVPHGHVLRVEESGQADGIVAVVLHGGPGSGSSPLLRRFFDPERYRIVSIDQRGAGRSQPRGSIADNTTPDLIADLEAVRALLNVPHWLVVGGSWGATLAVAYAAVHPHAVAGLLLRASFLARAEDMASFFQDTACQQPAAWQRFAAVAPVDRRDALLPFLAESLANAPTQDHVARQLALAWWQWEAAMASATPPSVELPEPDAPALDALVDRYRVQSHYMAHHCWLDDPSLLDLCDALPVVPTALLHATNDKVCPPAGALALHQRIGHSRLQWIDGAGHDPSHPAMVAAMVHALNGYASFGHFDGVGRMRVKDVG
jgi:proline iminopeptidase